MSVSLHVPDKFKLSRWDNADNKDCPIQRNWCENWSEFLSKLIILLCVHLNRSISSVYLAVLSPLFRALIWVFIIISARAISSVIRSIISLQKTPKNYILFTIYASKQVGSQLVYKGREISHLEIALGICHVPFTGIYSVSLGPNWVATQTRREDWNWQKEVNGTRIFLWEFRTTSQEIPFILEIFSPKQLHLHCNRIFQYFGVNGKQPVFETTDCFDIEGLMTIRTNT